MKKNFYITTTLPYVNSIPHIGHAMEFIRADIIARYNRSLGREVFFNTGTDEHGQKIYEGAQKENLSPQEYVDKYSKYFLDFCKICNISYDGFLRTTEHKHILAAQKMWNICISKGDIFKSKQKIHYCIGCEMEKTDSDLDDKGRCPDHPNRDLIITEEENYFFRFSKYQDQLLQLYKNNLVKPDFRNNEITKFVQSGLRDFSVSRLKSKMPWGIPIPNDEDHVMYVWFDALNSYISTLNWGVSDSNCELFDKFWNHGEVVQYCGKDNNKSQSAIWQSMLLSAGIKNTDIININGHIISNGVKMSKSIGNVISPFDIIEKYKDVTDYPEDVLRFMMCHEVSNYDDSDITLFSIDEAYKVFLQNGIGNQVSRILKLTSMYLEESLVKNMYTKIKSSPIIEILDKDFVAYMNEFNVNEAIHFVTNKSKQLDQYIQETSPFKLVKNNPNLSDADNLTNLQNAKSILESCIKELLVINLHMSFFMPKTSDLIFDLINKNQSLEKGIFNKNE